MALVLGQSPPFPTLRAHTHDCVIETSYDKFHDEGTMSVRLPSVYATGDGKQEMDVNLRYVFKGEARKADRKPEVYLHVASISRDGWKYLKYQGSRLIVAWMALRYICSQEK